MMLTNSYGNELFLIGGGGHALSVSEVAHDLGYKIIGSVVSKDQESTPFDFIDEEVETKYLTDKWNTIMDKMIYSFGVIKNDGLFEKYDEEEWNRIQEGLNLFAKHYTSLWD